MSAGERLNELLQAAGLEPLSVELAGGFESFFSLFLRWNARMNLSSVRDEEGILSRHFVESIACARALPEGIGSLLDFGSGGGIPGIPIALCRPGIKVTLAESQRKKAAFLHEAVRTVGIQSGVHAGRAETLDKRFDCVVLRAVDRMAEAVQAAAGLVAGQGWIGLMTTEEDLPKLKSAAGVGLAWSDSVSLPGSERRIVALGQKRSTLGQLGQHGA